MTYYNAAWTAKMRQHALDVDGTTNTLILGKTADGWRYRMATWELGPVVWPGWDAPADVTAPFTPNRAGLIALLDRWRSLGAGVAASWSDWKTEHPEVFA